MTSFTEPERYELFEHPIYRFELDRRAFLEIVGAGVLVLLWVDSGKAQRRRGPRLPRELGAWLHIDDKGITHVYTGKAEIGQNIRTSLSQVVAEELGVPLAKVDLVMADTDRVPYDRGTFGSQTTPIMAPQLRSAAAAARAALVELAAKKWNVDAKEVSVAEGSVRHKDRSLTFGQLTKGEKLVRNVGQGTPRPSKDWTIAGTSAPKVNIRAMVTGAHKYASDISRPGMRFGKVLRPPSFGAELTRLDASAAEAMKDVTVVRDGDFVGVVAPTAREAERAIAVLDAEWTTSEHISDQQLFDHLVNRASGGGGRRRWGRRSGGNRGSIADGLSAAAFTHERRYKVAYIAHAPLEPRVAVAEWKEGALTVWTGTQRPFGVKSELARALRIGEDHVRVIVPDTGSGYGGKHSGEYAVEVARLARTAGCPVKLAWTREEEFTWAYFRPAGVITIHSGVSKDGKLTAWECHNYNSGSSALTPSYEIPNQKVEFHRTDSPLRQGSYRALAATANLFARESHIDDLARKVAMDPLDFRLNNITHPRLRRVLETAARKFGWKSYKPGKRRAAGLAVGTEKGSFIATVAEVSCPEDGEVSVERVVAAFDCGTVINPGHTKNQIQGAIVQGLGGALFEAIEFADGRITNPRFSAYRVPRFTDAPHIEAVLVDDRSEPSVGAGETPLVAIAPAVRNAILAATGDAIDDLPLL